ncbi:MAG TPA: mechanosensitive ion channel, partial [bacterium]|nr:mechanosensitive ion channel [bacterium]
MFQNLSFSNLYQLIDNSANEKIFQAVLVFIIFYLLLKIFKLTIISRLQRIADQTPSKLDDLGIKIINSYGSLFYIFTPLYITSLITSISTRIDSILYKSSVIIFIYYIAKTVAAIIIFVVTNSLRTHYQNNKEKIDPTLENLVALIVRLVVWSIAIILVLQNLNYNISALLGGLGILGVAVAFGMQNILADLFSFFTIYLDKPFKSGDYVIINDLQSGT